MLEALCTLRSSADGFRQQGDVIVLVLPGHPWGTQEMKKFLRVKWQDDNFELSLTDRQKAGEQWPVITLPYGGDSRQSSKVVDLDALPNKGDVFNPDTVKGVLELAQYTLKGAVVVKTGVVATVVDAVTSAASWLWSKVVG